MNAVVAMEAAPRDRRIDVELNDSISVETVAPAIIAIQAAQPGEVVVLHVRHNGGGDVDLLFSLISAIATSKAQIEIVFGRYIMSAAATLWLWFVLWPVPHVKARLPRKPAVVLYHRPRRTFKDTYYCFAEDFNVGDPVRVSLEEKVRIFDELFERVLEVLGWAKLEDTSVINDGVEYQHWLKHLREAYYGNKDCLIPVEVEAEVKEKADENVRVE